eukprot:scaffold112526_cov57-Phaeocystis_antarctica.AAC.1
MLPYVQVEAVVLWGRHHTGPWHLTLPFTRDLQDEPLAPRATFTPPTTCRAAAARALPRPPRTRSPAGRPARRRPAPVGAR